MAPAGVAVWPGTATHVANRVWLPSRPTTTIASVSWCAFSGARHTQRRLMEVPQCWPLTATVDVSRVVPTWAIASDDAVTCWDGGDDHPSRPTNNPMASTAAAAVDATQVVTRLRRRRQRTVASRDGNSFSDISVAGPDWSIAATSAWSSWDSRAGTPLRSATAARQARQCAMCTSNSRRSAADKEPNTYAASHIA